MKVITLIKMEAVLELCPGRKVGGDHPCFVIAEIGINHQGDVNIAKRMIKVAKVMDRRITASTLNQSPKGKR